METQSLLETPIEQFIRARISESALAPNVEHRALILTVRALLDQHRCYPDTDGTDGEWCVDCWDNESNRNVWGWPCKPVRAMAATWRDHPDFDREAWMR